VTLVIRDNGIGFTQGTGGAEPGHGGFGLTGMAERARLLGGELTVQTAPGRGTVMSARIPSGSNARA
jgi:signal transduction histidine kinase